MEQLVSVIVPVYNTSQFLVRCLDSIVAQTYRTIEVLLINDGSTDNSGDICKQYAQQDDRVSCYVKPNGGLSDARNYGLERAQGRYVVLIDSDDTLDHNYIKCLVEEITATDADVCVCNFDYTDEDDKLIGNAPREMPKEHRTMPGREFLRYSERQGSTFFLGVWQKLYKKELFDSLRFLKGVLSEDVFFFHQLFLECGKVCFVDKPLYHYRQRAGSIINSKYKKERLAAIDALDERIKAYEENGLKNLRKHLYLDYAYHIAESRGRLDFSDKANKQAWREKKQMYNARFGSAITSGSFKTAAVYLAVFFAPRLYYRAVISRRLKEEQISLECR